MTKDRTFQQVGSTLSFPGKHVVGVLDSLQEAEQAVQALVDAGYHVEDMALIPSQDFPSALQEHVRKEGRFWQIMHQLLTTVYNCAQIKLTTPRNGGSLWEMVLSIPTGDGHDQEQDSEYHTRISKPRQVHSRHCHHLGHSQEHGAQIPAPSRTGHHAPSASQSSFQARSV